MPLAPRPCWVGLGCSELLGWGPSLHIEKNKSHHFNPAADRKAQWVQGSKGSPGCKRGWGSGPSSDRPYGGDGGLQEVVSFLLQCL